MAALGDASPGMTALVALMGGTVAAGAHATKAGTRVVVNTSPEPFSNWILSLAEDGFVVALGLLALKYPLAALAVSSVVIVGILMIAAVLIRAFRRRFGRGPRRRRRPERIRGIRELENSKIRRSVRDALLEFSNFSSFRLLRSRPVLAIAARSTLPCAVPLRRLLPGGLVTYLLRSLSGARFRRVLRVSGAIALLSSANGIAIRAGGARRRRRQTQTRMEAGLKPRLHRRRRDAQARFRAEANFVRVDVFPTVDGKPVRDLTQADFELLEDGVPQTIRTFEQVTVRGPGPDTVRREPTSARESREMVESGRARLIVIFLDTYHVDSRGIASHAAHAREPAESRGGSRRFVCRDDARHVGEGHCLARRPKPLKATCSRYWFWGQRDECFLTIRRTGIHHMLSGQDGGWWQSG